VGTLAGAISSNGAGSGVVTSGGNAQGRGYAVARLAPEKLKVPGRGMNTEIRRILQLLISGVLELAFINRRSGRFGHRQRAVQGPAKASSLRRITWLACSASRKGRQWVERPSLVQVYRVIEAPRSRGGVHCC